MLQECYVLFSLLFVNLKIKHTIMHTDTDRQTTNDVEV